MSGPCLCGDPYCPSCGDPGAAAWEALVEHVEATLDAENTLRDSDIEATLALLAQDPTMATALEDWYARTKPQRRTPAR